MPATFRLSILLMGSLAALTLFGCGDTGFVTAPVRGKVTYLGKPLHTGTILFMPDGDKPSAVGEIQPDGSYKLTTYDENDGAVLGKHAVMITAVDPMTDKLPEERSPTPALLIPARYGNFSTSGLTAEVGEGENTIDFTLSAR